VAGRIQRSGRFGLLPFVVHGRASWWCPPTPNPNPQEQAMAMYVDGFVTPVPLARLDDYKRMARKAGKIWREHGALEFRECVAPIPGFFRPRLTLQTLTRGDGLLGLRAMEGFGPRSAQVTVATAAGPTHGQRPALGDTGTDTRAQHAPQSDRVAARRLERARADAARPPRRGRRA
jgi:hypothetical protein